MLDSKLLGKRIQQYRREKKWTAERLAEEIDVSVPYIREMERGAKTPSMKMFIELANKLGVTADSLLCDSVREDSDIVSNELADKVKNSSPEKMKIISAVVDALIKTL